MAKRLYTKKTYNRPIRGLVTGGAGLILAGFLIVIWGPDNWWKESLVILVGFLSILLITSWTLRKFKNGLIVTVGVFSLLILKRLGIFDPATVIGLLLILGLIALVN